MTKKLIKITSFFVLLTGLSLFTGQGVDAAPYWASGPNGRAECEGYRSGHPDCSVGFDVLDGGIKFELGNHKQDAVKNFMKELRSKYEGKKANGRDLVGVAFIYNTMMGNAPSGVSETDITSEMLDDLEGRLMYFVNNNFGAVKLVSYSTYDNTMIQSSGKDVTWYKDVDAEGGPRSYEAYVFYHGDLGINYREFYVIKKDCANPLGNTPGIPPPPPPPPPTDWTINGQSYIEATSDKSGRLPALRSSNVVSESYPGQRLYWWHDLRNNGPAAINPGLQVNIDKYNFPVETGWSGAYTISTNIGARAAPGRLFLTHYPPGAAYTSYDLSSRDVGRNLCQRIAWYPGSSPNWGWKWSANACARVYSDFDLYSQVSSGRVVTVGTQPTFSQSIINTKSLSEFNSDGRVAVYDFILPAGTPMPSSALFPGKASGSNNFFTVNAAISDHCTWLKSNRVAYSNINSCMRVYSSPLNDVFTGTRGLNGVPQTKLSGNPGDRICRFVAVRDYTSVYNSWTTNPLRTEPNASYRNNGLWHRLFEPVCTSIANLPYISLVGSSAWAGGGTGAATSPISTKSGMTGTSSSIFGSFGEYGLFATAGIDTFSSAGMLNSKRLTFANTTTPLGQFKTTHVISDLNSYYRGKVGVSNMTFNGNMPSMPTTSGVYGSNNSSNRIVLNTATIGPKTHLVIYIPDNELTIAGDITFSTTGAKSFADLPSLTVIAKNINVNANVKRLDGNFYTMGNFRTCVDPNPSMPVDSKVPLLIPNGTCYQNPLIVNGSITSLGKIIFNRSSGGSQPGEPSEMVRMRPESFLTTFEANRSSTTMPTVVYETELPPRY